MCECGDGRVSKNMRLCVCVCVCVCDCVRVCCVCAALETAERARGIAATDNVLLDEARRTGGLGGMRAVPPIDAMARQITGTPLDAALDASGLVDVMLGALHVRQEAGERACLVLCV